MHNIPNALEYEKLYINILLRVCDTPYIYDSHKKMANGFNLKTVWISLLAFPLRSALNILVLENLIRYEGKTVKRCGPFSGLIASIYAILLKI